MPQSYLKASIDGLNGSGKTGTAARLAVGISVEYCGRAPVVVFDSEERWRFLQPVIFDVERVPLIILAGQSLVRCRKAIASVEPEGACVFVGDQLTTPWKEGLRSFSLEDGRLPFDRRQQLENEWEPVVRNFRYGKFHAICNGRLGYNWQNIEDENGKLELVQGDSKFNAGGGNNFGYEADLELEMRRRKRSLLGLIRGKTSVEHVCDVIKDAASGVLNGEQFIFPSQKGLYRMGDYKAVLDPFRPYLDFMQKVPPPDSSRLSTSEDLVVSGKTDWARDQSRRKGLLEEMDGYLNLCFPGGEKRSKLDAMFRNLTLEALNGSISWSRMEEEVSTPQLDRNVQIMKALRQRIQNGEKPTDHNSLVGLLKLSTDDVLHPGNPMTLLELMTMGAKRGPQPIVGALDRQAPDEMDVAGD